MGALVEQAPPSQPPAPEPGFTVIHQKVLLDINPRLRSLTGYTRIQIVPLSAELKSVRLNCRQLEIKKMMVGDRAVGSMTYSDPYRQIQIPWDGGVHQHHMLREKVEKNLGTNPEPELMIGFPKNFKIKEATQEGTGDNKGDAVQYEIVEIYIEFSIKHIRDGLHFVGWDAGDLQYPHIFTGKESQFAACALFPCVESMNQRCTWELLIKTPRTIGDALRTGIRGAKKSLTANFSDEDLALDLNVIGPGDLTDEVVEALDSSKKTTTFFCTTNVAPEHIGFVIGPFEHLDLSQFRENVDDEKLTKAARPIHGFCLPGRLEEMRNACFPLAQAMDYFSLNLRGISGSSFKICFVDDMLHDHITFSSLALCSNRLLFPDNIIDPLDSVTRELVYCLASQFSGVDIVPKDSTDTWVVVGMAYFITDLFLRHLTGNNEYRFLQSRASEKVCDLDVSRPSMFVSGLLLHFDPSHRELIRAKAPLVLFILDRRLTKADSSHSVLLIINHFLRRAGVNSLALSTSSFQKQCEKGTSLKLDTFFEQWVMGAGCPRFRVTQRFNKKRLVVEMQIQQAQQDLTNQDLQPETFMRDVKEEYHEIYAEEVQTKFTGPMTIRIHEADGTPYEHMVEIKDTITRFDVPYNTKYKRLKRRKKVATGLVEAGDDGEDALLYCLGDVLQTPEEEAEWNLSNWSKEDEERMSGESYEWIRMDADFEWICQMNINMPGYMYVSQLQQDRDVSAQYETVRYLGNQKPFPLISTILLRTLMDRRYFHGIRTAAARAMSNHAAQETGFIGLKHLIKAFKTLFCYPGLETVRPNDFGDREAYYVRCEIIQSVARVRDSAGRAPLEVRRFLFDALRENDNSKNEYSDSYYLAQLMKGLAEAQASAPLPDSDEYVELADGDDYQFQRSCIEEMSRHSRMDEWIPSYQNIISRASLDCRRILTKGGALPMSATDYLPYTQEQTNELLRISAFENMLHLGLFNHDSILTWLLFVSGFDRSPYIRHHARRIVGEWLGKLAIGTSEDKKPVIEQVGSLVIEQEASTEARKADIERKQTVTGAIQALKVECSESEVLKAALWSALRSRSTRFDEAADFLTICGYIYEPETRMLVKLKYPSYYRAESTGRTTGANGRPRLIIRFVPSRARTKPLPKSMVAPKPAPPPPPAKANPPKSGITLSLKPPKKPGANTPAKSQAQAAPATKPPSTPGTPATEGKQRLMLKLKMPSAK